MWLTLRCDQK
jgi:hypothetical protein